MRVTQKVREHLRFLEQNGRLTPDRVVVDAKRPDSPLHPYFTWDVNVAAAKHWLDQARDLIHTVKYKVTINEVRIDAPYYIPDPTKASAREQGYTSMNALRQDPASAKQSLLSECERAAAMLRRARLIALSLDLGDEVDAILAAVAGLRQRLDGGDEAGLPQ